MCVELAPDVHERPRPRVSIVGGPVPPHVDFLTLGQYFPFENREKECTALLRAWAAMDAHRSVDGLEAHKRSVCVPVCTGMPGIGKSRFARVAVWHLAMQETKTRPGTDVLHPSIVEAVCRKAWPDEAMTETRSRFVHALLSCYQSNRNLRVDCSFPMSESGEDVLTATAVRLLTAWRRPRNRESFEVELLRRLRDSGAALTLTSAFRAILHSHGRLEEEAAVIVNVDEAQALTPYELSRVVHGLVGILCNSNIQVMLTITGVSGSSVRAAVHASGAGITELVLPLLEERHLQSICAAVLSCRQWDFPSTLLNALWWLGGVPRFLEMFLRCTADKVDAKGHIEAVAKWLLAASSSGILDVLKLTYQELYASHLRAPAAIPKVVLGNIFSLAVAERRVPLRLTLCAPEDGECTVQAAQDHQLLYWEPCGDNNAGTVRMPPLVLHHLHLGATGAVGARVYPLSNISVHMSPDTNETLAISVMMHRLRAAFVACQASLTIAEMIGLDADVLGTRNFSVDIPGSFDVRVLDGRIDKDDFPSFASTVRKGLVTNPSTTPVAYVNGRGASFADAFIIFPNCSIFIHVARRNRAIGRSSSLLSEAEINRELAKIMPIQASDVFVLITDKAAPRSLRLPDGVVVVPQCDHAGVLGTILSKLRAHALAESEPRSDSPRSSSGGEAGASVRKRARGSK